MAKTTIVLMDDEAEELSNMLRDYKDYLKKDSLELSPLRKEICKKVIKAANFINGLRGENA